MSYSRINWKNNETALNETNLNKMDEAIETNDKAITTANTNITAVKKTAESAVTAAATAKTAADAAQATADTAKTTADNARTIADTKSIVTAAATGTSTDEIQYITINGTEHKLAGGGDKVNYYERDTLNLNEVYDTGIYKVGSCTNGPKADESGLLKVQKLSDELAEQEWISQTCLAFRLNKPSSSKQFYIAVDDGTEALHEQGDFELDYGHLYKMRGELDGSIKFVLPADVETATHATKIILDGVTINSTKDYAISYGVEDKKLIVELRGDKYNYLIVNDKVTEEETSSTGALHSENNMLVYGTGYLSIKSDKGHAIKASELEFSGIPHIYCEVAHDGLHGSHALKVCDGVYYIQKANDAIGFSDSDETKPNTLNILGGKIVVGADVAQNCVDAPLPSGTKTIVGANIILNKEFDEDHPAFTDTIKVTDTVTLSGIGSEGITQVALSSLYGAPIVKYTGGARQATDKVFIIDDISDIGDVTLSGNFTGYRVEITRNKEAKPNVFFDGVYLNDTEDNSEPFINYIDNWKAKKRIKFEANVGTLNYLYKKTGDIIDSATNIQIDNKGDVICLCKDDIALNAENGYILLGNDGCRKINSVKANSVRVGKDIEDVIDEKYSIASTALYVTDLIMYTPETSYSVADYREMIIAPQYFDGCAIFSGNMTYVNGAPATIKFDAQVGNIKITDDNDDPTGEEYYNEACVYAKTCNYTQTNILPYTLPKEYNPDFPESENTWTYIFNK